MATAWLRFVTGTLALVASCGHAASLPPPAAAFFEEPEFTGAELSPSGKHVALRFAPQGGRQKLAVANLADMSVKVVGSFNDLDVNRFYWVNDERLVFDSRDSRTTWGQASRASGMWAVNRDGSLSRQLVDTRGASFVQSPDRKRTQPWNTFFLHGGLPQDSDHIYVGQYTVKNFLIDSVELLRLNTITGQARPIAGPGKSRYWVFDAKGQPRAVLTADGPREILHYRASDEEEWRKVVSYERMPRTLNVEGFAPDGSLYASAARGEDTLALYKMDLATGQLADKPLVRITGFDFDGSLVGTDRLLGVRFRGDGVSTFWFDDKLKAVQARVDEKLPGTFNLVSVARRSASPWALVMSESDSSPPAYWTFHMETGALSPIGRKYPRIDPATMSRTDLVRYTARDGMEIPAWLTLPRTGSGKNLPLVVLVHDGPNRRGRGLEWNAPAQFLASRGFAVLEPEYRGSTGFGARLALSGVRQWGLKMQDDLADGARWAIGQGIADAKRLCIMGHGYGGYAALMGTVTDPDLYQCAASYGAVTDIGLLFNGQFGHDDANSEDAKAHFMPFLIGDPAKDAEQFRMTSPLARAAQMRRPLLLAHGERNLLVPIYHGRKFRDAVAKTNQPVEWIEYEGETHELDVARNRIDYWTRVASFLDKHIGRK